MVAINNTVQEFEYSQELRKSLQEATSVNRSGRVFLATVLILSAVGLWIVPVGAGDPAMLLIKMLISLVLLALGAMFLSSISERDYAPEIQIDTKNRELRIIEHKGPKRERVETAHALDALTEVALKDQVFSARTSDGALAITVPIRDKASETALRAAFHAAA